MTLQYGDVDDAVLLTQEKLVKRGAFTDLQSDLQDHVAVRELWKKKKMKFDGGETWDWQAQTDHNHSFRTVGIFETDGTALTDTMVTGKVEPKHCNAHYIYDQREPAFQRGGTKIVDLVKSRYVAMMVSFYEGLEAILWSKPTDSSDTRTPFGVAYWVVANATEGFNGGNPSGFTAGRGGISTGDVARWANWAAQYVEISKQDLVRKMRKAHRNTKFRSPVSHSEPTVGSMSNGIYTNDDVIGLVEEELEKQNMNLGNDLNSKGGKTLFKGTPLTWAPYLDADSTDPVYMLDWNWLTIGILSGWENQLTKPYMVPDKHLVRRVDLDVTLQMICTNLRRQAIIAKA